MLWVFSPVSGGNQTTSDVFNNNICEVHFPSGISRISDKRNKTFDQYRAIIGAYNKY